MAAVDFMEKRMDLTCLRGECSVVKEDHESFMRPAMALRKPEDVARTDIPQEKIEIPATDEDNPDHRYTFIYFIRNRNRGSGQASIYRYFTAGWKDFVDEHRLGLNSRVKFTWAPAPQYLLRVKVLGPGELQQEAPAVEVPVSEAPPSKSKEGKGKLSEAEAIAVEALLMLKESSYLVPSTSTATRTCCAGRVLLMELSDTDQNFWEHIFHFVCLNRPITESVKMRLPEKITDDAIKDEAEPPHEVSHPTTVSEGYYRSYRIVSPDNVTVTMITAFLFPSYCGNNGIQILHENQKVLLGVCYASDAPPNVCLVLDGCHNHAQRFLDSGSKSDWSVAAPDDGTVTIITAFLFPSYCGDNGIQILHEKQKVLLGVCYAADAPPSGCLVPDACHNHAQRFLDSGSKSDSSVAVTRKNKFCNFRTIQLLHIPIPVARCSCFFCMRVAPLLRVPKKQLASEARSPSCTCSGGTGQEQKF